MMLFIEWYPILVNCILFGLLGIAAFIFWSVRRKRAVLRLPLRLVAFALALCPVFMLLIAWTFPNPNSHSMPVYSPDRKSAARVWNYDPGPLGRADSSVQIFTAHGFLSRTVFHGEWQSVKPENIRWTSDTRLEISSGEAFYQCTSTRQIRVQCVKTPQRDADNGR
jgi:hypothetical protein